MYLPNALDMHVPEPFRAMAALLLNLDKVAQRLPTRTYCLRAGCNQRDAQQGLAKHAHCTANCRSSRMKDCDVAWLKDERHTCTPVKQLIRRFNRYMMIIVCKQVLAPCTSLWEKCHVAALRADAWAPVVLPGI